MAVRTSRPVAMALQAKPSSRLRARPRGGRRGSQLTVKRPPNGLTSRIPPGEADPPGLPWGTGEPPRGRAQWLGSNRKVDPQANSWGLSVYSAQRFGRAVGAVRRPSQSRRDAAFLARMRRTPPLFHTRGSPAPGGALIDGRKKERGPSRRTEVQAGRDDPTEKPTSHSLGCSPPRGRHRSQLTWRVDWLPTSHCVDSPERRVSKLSPGQPLFGDEKSPPRGSRNPMRGRAQ